MAVTETERDLLGAALLDPRLTESITIHPGDFVDGRHAAIWQALTTLHQEGTTPDPATITRTATGARIDHHMIVDLVGRGIPSNAETYADDIREAARVRRISDALAKANQMVREGDTSDTIGAALAAAIDPPREEEEAVEDAMTLDEFVSQDLPPEEWIIPGLLTKGDRTIITGAEGLGKTQLIRQIAICTAAGIHPFTFQRFQPKRVLYVDCENPKRIMVNKLAEIRKFLELRDMSTDDRMWIKRFPQGLDLAQVSDRLLLRSLCRAFRPDMLIIGPVYKLYVGGGQEKDEALARQVTSAMDKLREEFGFALILEHHAGHGQQGQRRSTRPFGSSLWLRWPEFGIGLARADMHPSPNDPPGKRYVDVQHWRGARDERDWPEELESHGVLPWLDSNPQHYAQGA